MSVVKAVQSIAPLDSPASKVNFRVLNRITDTKPSIQSYLIDECRIHSLLMEQLERRIKEKVLDESLGEILQGLSNLLLFRVDIRNEMLDSELPKMLLACMACIIYS